MSPDPAAEGDRSETLSRLSLAQLRTFDVVMRAGGYAAAARRLHVSVPAVWQHVHALEQVYRVRLFDRVGRQVHPTDAARRLHEQIDPILVQLDSTLDVAAASTRERSIRMVTGVRMLLEDLVGPVAAFHRRYPNQLEIRHGNESRAEELLLTDQADIAMALEPGLRRSSPRIHYEPAYTVEFLAVANKRHPYAKTRSSALRELARQELVVTVAGTHGRDALDQAFHREGLAARIAVETDNSAFTIACVTAGLGVGILAGRRDGALCGTLAVKSLSKQLGQRKIVLMWRKGRILSEPLLGLIDEVKRLDD